MANKIKQRLITPLSVVAIRPSGQGHSKFFAFKIGFETSYDITRVIIAVHQRNARKMLLCQFIFIDFFLRSTITLDVFAGVKLGWYLATKYLFPTGRKFSFLSITSILGVAFGVIVLFVVSSVMDGFQAEICSKIVGTQGQIKVDSECIIPDSEEVRHVLLSDSSVTHASEYVMGILMLQFGSKTAFPFAKGVDMELESKVVPLKNFIAAGSADAFDDSAVIISSGLANALGVEIGDSVDVYSPLMLQNLQSDELLLPRSFDVIAICNTGWNQVDANFILLSLRAMRELFGMEDGDSHGLIVKLRSGADLEKSVMSLKQKLPGMRVLSWQELNGDFLFVLRLEKTMMIFVLLFILLVASFSIASSLMISVVKKRREIGLLCAFGATKRSISLIFIFEGLGIGLLGSVFGLIFGYVVLAVRNGILAVLVKLSGINDFLLKFYDFAQLPVKYSVGSIAVIVAFTILVCCMAGLIPALVVARLSPSHALRNE
ncbi:MAG: ABC transporter permease [Puniceicoccales bacterium]|nr:ABC transporter permease [Puniceicoccales bacterium]